MRNQIYSVLSIFFLFLYGMILAHNMIPHDHYVSSVSEEPIHDHKSHHVHVHVQHDHNQQHNEENQNDSSSDWSHPFIGQNHLEEATNSITSITYSFTKVSIVDKHQFDLIGLCSVNEEKTLQKIERPPILYESPFEFNDPLRGPPSIV